jgi:serine/threonine protein kinase
MEPSLGSELGTYRLIRELGRGGMGIVYEAKDLVLERRVALKVMRGEARNDSKLLSRFIREARASAVLEHENIVTIYQVGEALGFPYIAMQLLSGENLDTLLERETVLPPETVIRIACEMCAGLDAAHQKGFIHRDIKPGNIWLEADTGRVKLLDFGLARDLESGQKLTQSDIMIGTPAFMSPEQARGEPVEARSDLFSLGCVLYFASTGVIPFQCPTVWETILNLEQKVPLAPTRYNPSLPEWFSDLIIRLLEKEPSFRPGSAREVREFLLNSQREALPQINARPVGKISSLPMGFICPRVRKQRLYATPN